MQRVIISFPRLKLVMCLALELASKLQVFLLDIFCVSHVYIIILCSGLTQSNYKELNVLYEKYKNQGLYFILARPCNKFVEFHNVSKD